MRNAGTRLVSVMLSLPRNSHSLRIRMSTILLVSMSSAFLTVTAQTVGSPEENVASRRERQEGELRCFVLQLQSLNEERPADPEVQLGLAILHQRYGRRDVSSHQRDKARFDSVLSIDPGNKAVWAIRAKDATFLAIARGKRVVKHLEAAIENAKKRGADRIRIRTGPSLGKSPFDSAQVVAYRDSLHEILGDGTLATVVVSEEDYDKARAKVKQRVDQGLMEAMATVDQAQEADPENALYNYYKANLHFALGQPDMALKVLRAAVRKPAVRTYYDQRQKAVTRALAAADAPSPLRSYVEPFNPIGDYLRNWIWKPYLVPLARKNEDQGDLAKAKKIYELSMGMAKHTREELPPEAEELLPHAVDFNRGVSQAIDSWARERLASPGKRGD